VFWLPLVKFILGSKGEKRRNSFQEAREKLCGKWEERRGKHVRGE